MQRSSSIEIPQINHVLPSETERLVARIVEHGGDMVHLGQRGYARRLRSIAKSVRALIDQCVGFTFDEKVTITRRLRSVYASIGIPAQSDRHAQERMENLREYVQDMIDSIVEPPDTPGNVLQGLSGARPVHHDDPIIPDSDTLVHNDDPVVLDLGPPIKEEDLLRLSVESQQGRCAS